MRAGSKFAIPLACGLGFIGATALDAKTCGIELRTRATARIAGDEVERDRRAQDAAVAKWTHLARAAYGVAFEDWQHAAERKSTCGRTAKTSFCSVAAKPCRRPGVE